MQTISTAVILVIMPIILLTVDLNLDLLFLKTT